jgi:hypothetical protein
VVASNASQSISIYFNDGTGNFSAPDIYGVPGVGGSKLRSSRLVIDELDGQPGLDVAVTLLTADKYAVFANDGTGQLSLLNTFATEKEPVDIKSADFDNDGDKDLVYANSDSGTVGVDINDGAGNFTNVGYLTSTTGTSPIDLTVGDYNKDGLVDFVSTQYNDGMISLFRNNGSLSFSVTEYTGVTNPAQLDTADVNNDTFLDVLAADSTLGGDGAVFLNDGTGAFAAAPALYSNTLDDGFGAKFVDLNADCYLDMVVSEHGFTLNSFLASPSAALSVTGASACATTTATLATTEGTSAATNTIELVGTPTQDVTITCSLASSVEATTTPSPLVFTVAAGSTAVPQTVSVTAIDDTDVESLDATTLVCTTASADANYNNLTLSLNVSIADNDKVVTTPVDPVCKPAKLGNEIYNDLNCNGKNESTEKGFGGVKVELRDEHGHEVDQDTTKSNGEYSLYAPEPGRYQVVVKEEDVDMYLQTDEPGNDAELNNTTWVDVEKCGEKITNLDFGYSAKECHLAVSGYDAMCVWNR